MYNLMFSLVRSQAGKKKNRRVISLFRHSVQDALTEFNNTAVHPRANQPDDLQVPVSVKCAAIVVVALAIYWYNFLCTVPRLAQGSMASQVNLAPAEMVTVGGTGTVLAETPGLASTSIDSRD